MKIVTAAEMREIDRATSERFGVHSLTLMENAGAAVADFALSHCSSARRVVVICGRGNNGGDGFVAARRLHQRGKHVQVVLLADPAELRGDAREMFSKVPVPVMAVHSSEEWKTERVQLTLHAELYIDAILGTGFKPPVSGLYAEAIAALNASTTPVVAVDIPSGADADVIGHQTGSVARANAIVTFTAPRPAHVFGELSTGPTYVAPIGSPDEAISSSLGLNVITAHDVAPIFAPRTPVILDADGLNAFANHASELNGSERPLVLTPHPGEMARLIGSTSTAVQRDRLNIARTFARGHQLILVLKGHCTLIAQPDGTVWVNTTGNPGMATGGTGDILTGMVAGFIAQNPERIFDAVLAAVHLHGLAGDVARETVGEHSLVATDLLKALPEAFRRARERAMQKLVRI